MSLLPPALLLPQQTLSRPGARHELPRLAAGFGPCGLLACGASFERSGGLAELLGGLPGGLTVQVWRHGGGEPTVTAVDQMRAEIRRLRPDWVAAVGGGSVLDLAKAAAGLAEAPETAAYYQTHNAAIPPATLPFIAAPTTAGTGSEATVVAVLTDPARILKQSLRHPSFMPRLVLLDPDLLAGCPPATVAAAGLDAFVQAFESYTSRFATPLTRSLSELALTRIAAALGPLFRGDAAAASDMLEGSYLAGLALSHARLGVVHGLAHPLGARFGVAHGLACALCLPAALAFNREHIRADLDALRARHGLDVEDAVAGWLAEMRPVNPFRGQPLSDRTAIVAETLASGSTGANPRPVSADDVNRLLDALFTE